MAVMARTTDKSQAAFARGAKVLVGGVNSPVRSMAAVGGSPPVIAKASGAHITDVDGNVYVDYVGSYGPMILGHAAEQVVTAISKQARRGTSYGAPCEGETLLAEAIVAAIDSIEKTKSLFEKLRRSRRMWHRRLHTRSGTTWCTETSNRKTSSCRPERLS